MPILTARAPYDPAAYTHEMVDGWRCSNLAMCMRLPGLKLHPLKGSRKGTWAVSVSGNWRITFKFSDGDAEVVDYED